MPWSIRVATVANGAGRQVWIAEKGPGSVFHQMVAERQLFWSAADRLVFPWERDGWLHLYSAAQDDIDRRPARASIQMGGMPIHAQLFLPPDSRPGQRHPALVFMHGGSRRQMLLGWHYMDYYNNAYGMNQYLASQGYVVLSINDRSGIGYGLDFREAINYGASGASEFHDVEGAGLYLKGRPDVDPAHIGLWGGSYGGYLTALGLARASSPFAAGVDFHGVHDWSARTPGNATQPVSSAPDPAREEAARVTFESSPMASVSTWRSPVLLIHGDDDRNVNFSETVTLAGALRRQGVYFEQLIIPDEIHGFLRRRSWLRAYHAAVDFFQRKL